MAKDQSTTELLIKPIPKTVDGVDQPVPEGMNPNHGAHLQMRLGTVVHSMTMFLFNPAYGGRQAFDRCKVQLTTSFPDSQADVETAFAKMEEATGRLKEVIETSLPNGLRHFVFVETPFQHDQGAMKQLTESVENNKYGDLLHQSGYSSIAEVARQILTKPGEKVKIGDEEFSIEEMVKIAAGEKKIMNSETTGLIKDLVTLSSYGYFLDRSGGIEGSLIASAVARSDLFFLSTEPSSEAEEFLKTQASRLFGRNMHNLVNLTAMETSSDRQIDSGQLADDETLEATGGNIYRKLINYILNGDITMTLVDIKVSTLNKIATSEGIKQTNFVTDEQKIDEMYGWDISHTFQAMLQSFMGISRALGAEAASDLSGLLDIRNVFNEGGLDTLIRFGRILKKQRFVIARMYYPILNKPDRNSPVCEIDRAQVKEEEPQVAATRLNARKTVWERLIKFYKYMKDRAGEEKEQA